MRSRGPAAVAGTNERAWAPPPDDERRAAQPAGESALAAAARRAGMTEDDVLDLAVARSAWRSMVTVRLGAGGVRPSWSKTPLPALTNLGELQHAVAFRVTGRELVTQSYTFDSVGEREGYFSRAFVCIARAFLTGLRNGPPPSHGPVP